MTGHRLRNGLLGILVALAIGIQFVPVRRDNPPVVSDVRAPAEVDALLRRACYDCHSHETKWPWYSYVAPISWRVAQHVRMGRGDLNFSDWPEFNLDEQQELLEEIREELSEGNMPLRDYLWLHPEAKLTEEEKATILAWARVGSGSEPGDDDEEEDHE